MKRRIFLRTHIPLPVSTKILIICTTVVLSIVGLMSLSSWQLRAVAKASSTHAKTVAPATELHEADHVLQGAVYTTREGWTSNLLLLNAEGKAVTARVTIYNKQGRLLNISPITLEAYTSNSWNIADWVRNADGFEEGSITVTYYGISMGLHAQETVSNGQRSLSFDVHFEDAMELMSSTVDGLWWGLDDRTEAKVFIANTRATQTTVTPTFYVAGVATQGDPIILDPHASDAIDVGKALKQKHLTPTLGGISLSSTNGPGAISVVGVISNKRSGFSTTMRFVDHMSGATRSLHGANIMIGKGDANPGFSSSTRFTPHVILRNNTPQVVQATARIRFTLLNQPNVTELPPIALAGNEVRELDMSPAMNALGDNSVGDAGIEIEHSGEPGALMAYAASIDQTGSNAFDVPIKDPKGMTFKGGANPWNLAGENRAVLHVKNVDAPDGVKHAFTVSLYYEGGVYNLPVQLVEAGQTAEIDIRKLRDDQVKDSTGNVIPLNVTRGQLSWFPRARKGDFIGRLVQYDPEDGTSSSFSCDEPCWCGPDYFSSYLVPSSFNGVPGDVFEVNAYEIDIDCRGWPHGPYHITYANFYTDNPFVADVFHQSSHNYVLLVGGGSTDITGYWDSSITVGEDCQQWDWASGWCEVPSCDVEQVTPSPQTSVSSATVDIRMNGNTVTNQTVNVIVGQEINLTTSVQPTNGTVTDSQWTVPGGNSDRIANYVVTFTDNQHPTSAVVTNLTSLTSSSVDFYWISGGNGRTVEYSAKVNGKPVHAQVTFNVQRPTAAITATASSTNIGVDSVSQLTELRLGNPDATPGITFTRSLTIPTGFNGSSEWVQVFIHKNASLTPSSGPVINASTSGLDDVYPYPLDSNATQTNGKTSDSPGIAIDGFSGVTFTAASVDFNATMWLLFQPSGTTGNKIWVPLRKVTWTWTAAASKSGSTWSITSHSDPGTLSDADATAHPVWTTNANTGQ